MYLLILLEMKVIMMAKHRLFNTNNDKFIIFIVISISLVILFDCKVVANSFAWMKLSQLSVSFYRKRMIFIFCCSQNDVLLHISIHAAENCLKSEVAIG